MQAAVASIAVGTGPLTEADVIAVARDGAGVSLTDGARTAIAASRTVEMP